MINRLEVLFARLGVDRDAMAPYRAAIAARGSLVAAWMLWPLAVYHAAHSRWMLAGFIAVASFVLVATARAIRSERYPPVLVPLGMAGLVAPTAGAIVLNGVNALLWAYPLLIVLYFVVPRTWAHLIFVVQLLAVSGAAAVVLGPDVALRVAATMVLTMVLVNLVINVVGELQESLRRQTITDPLTGAFNRRHFDDQLAQVSAQAASHQDALVAIDVDHFKSINDRHGHGVGDEVLRTLVSTVRARTRSTDQLFRTGGEEFMLLLHRVNAEQAMRIAENLRIALEAAPMLPGERVTVSMGVSMRPHGAPVDAWMKRSDEALYDAKRTGRNRVVLAPVG